MGVSTQGAPQSRPSFQVLHSLTHSRCCPLVWMLCFYTRLNVLPASGHLLDVSCTYSIPLW